MSALSSLYSRLPLKPVKFLLRIRLITPATASEPQSAETPPVTTSTRETRVPGIVLRSTPPLTFENTTRWPSNSTRVRRLPRLCSETLDWAADAPEIVTKEDPHSGEN